MDDLTYNALRTKISELTLQNKQLKRASINAKRENKYLKHVIRKLKENQNKHSGKRKKYYEE